jgi:hypothetical protein
MLSHAVTWRNNEREERSGNGEDQTVPTVNDMPVQSPLSPTTKPVLGNSSWRYPWCARTSKESGVSTQIILAQWKAAVKEFTPT